MRRQFDQDLRRITDGLVGMTRLVGSAVADATTALLDADLRLAEDVIAADAEVDGLGVLLEEHVLATIACQAPVAADLRFLVAALRMGADLERMGDLAVHVAKIARMRYPASAVPDVLRGPVAEMGRVAAGLAAKDGAVIARRDADAAAALEAEDDAMDRLHRSLFRTLLDDSWEHGVEAAIDVTLIGRYYERYADQAVSVARRVVFQVTGELPRRVVLDQRSPAPA